MHQRFELPESVADPGTDRDLQGILMRNLAEGHTILLIFRMQP